MKSCPVCNRTYTDETLTFCLDDGSTLSATYGHHETERISASRNTDPAPTEVLYPGSRADAFSPSLPPTVPSFQPPPYQEKSPLQTQEKRSNKTGLVLALGVILGAILALVITGRWMWSGENKAADNRAQSNVSNSNVSNVSGSNSNVSNANVTAPAILNELPGRQWRECEATAGYGEICGRWTRKSKEQWHAQWGEVQATLDIIVEGKNVTVKRRDTTSSLEATYRGTLNTGKTQITGTVDWCCDQFGNRSGEWRAEIAQGEQ